MSVRLKQEYPRTQGRSLQELTEYFAMPRLQAAQQATLNVNEISPLYDTRAS